MQLSDIHMFAFYAPDFWRPSSAAGDLQSIIDSDLVHRLTKVLRIEIGEIFVLFDQKLCGQVKVQEISKKEIVVEIITVVVQTERNDKIVFWLPLLKREALQEAVYSLAEIGVSSIQLVITQKSRQNLLHDKEFERLQATVIAAAEQSKNYQFPELLKPEKLEMLLQHSSATSVDIVFDVSGDRYHALYSKIQQASVLRLLVGPEGGLTDVELKNVQTLGFLTCRLTDTILRAVQSVALAAGLFRL
ncbi:RsmE family RNA methyltransferase [Candidatus Babeliales bacterium]|nr:RsmE family RNA methyltransferase [Candidatus Babeliales bacterium]